jgi:hypothetical protein
MERHPSVNSGLIDAAGSGPRAWPVECISEFSLTNSLR